jgi:hypothetical protein
MWNRIAIYTRKNPARIAGYLSALVMYVNKHFPDLPLDIVIPSVMLMIGLGESSQRLENKKTRMALYSDNDPNIPDDEIINEIAKGSSEFHIRK